MTETDLFRWLTAEGRGWFQRVESTAGTGVPDVHYILGGVSGWIELKIAPMHPDRAVALSNRIRPAQRAWIARYARAGGRAYVLVGDARGHSVRMSVPEAAENLDFLDCSNSFIVPRTPGGRNFLLKTLGKT